MNNMMKSNKTFKFKKSNDNVGNSASNAHVKPTDNNHTQNTKVSHTDTTKKNINSTHLNKCHEFFSLCLNKLKFYMYINKREKDAKRFQVAEAKFNDAIANKFDAFITAWIIKYCYNSEFDGFAYFSKEQKRESYIDFVTNNYISVSDYEFVEYTYKKFIVKLDHYFLEDCYLLTDEPYRIYKFKY